MVDKAIFRTIDNVITWLISMAAALLAGISTFRWIYGEQLEDTLGVRMRHTRNAAGKWESQILPADTISWLTIWLWTITIALGTFVMVMYVVDSIMNPDQSELPSKKERRQSHELTIK